MCEVERELWRTQTKKEPLSANLRLSALPQGRARQKPASHSGRGGCVQPERADEMLQPTETFQETSLQKCNKIGMLPKLRSVLTSYLAYSSKANSFRILVKTLHPHQWLKNFFRIFRTKAEFLEDLIGNHIKIITNFFWSLQ